MIENVLEKIHWLGHDGFLIEASEGNIYIDPFQLEGNLPPADLILVTHEHYDHCSPEDIAKITQNSTIIVTEKDSAEKLSGNLKVVAPGDAMEIGGVKIETVPAYNTNKAFHPKENGWLGFILEVDGVRIYHAGDTDIIPEMKKVKVDIALLPVSGTYVMTAAEAAKAADDIKAKISIPMHYDAIVGSSDDAASFADDLDGKLQVRVLKKSRF